MARVGYFYLSEKSLYSKGFSINIITKEQNQFFIPQNG